MTTILLSRSDIAALMRPADYIAAAEEGFRAAKQGRAASPPPLHLECTGGGFHAKAASLTTTRDYAALKLNGNFPGNPAQGLPTIQGAILLSDAADGTLLAVMDSGEVTLQRTAAATALAARFLARADSRVVAIIGCGDQARAQLAALLAVLPLSRCLVFDRDADHARRFADLAGRAHDLECVAMPDVASATLAADVIVTVTTSSEPVLDLAQVRPGTFIAAVGADSPHKQELTPALMAASRIVVDVLEQSLAMGDLRHAVAAGLVAASDVHAELGDLVVGNARGREDVAETWIFDSTGTALQDVAAAALIYERAIAAGSGTPFAFNR